MTKAKNIAAVLTATALAAAFAVPAFAATPGVEDGSYEKAEIAGGSFEAPTDIKATVHAPGAKVIKVTVPSQLPIGVATKVGSGSAHVIDADKTLPVQAEVRNYSQDSAVDVSVAKVADDSNLLEKISLSLAPATTMGTPGSDYSLAKGDSIDAPLFTNLAGTADGATNPGVGSLTLTASASPSEDLTSLEGSHTVTAVLKVSVPTA
ncbi:hypothetical protein [Eggerthella guodeyinii]|uniref:WxL domain-containing protein n=1 Tax=Eggerthella guodeyinii TaxID=2690837 RepID=A0A6N7RKG9_9ACTN|nr:hypothetical protein [Eggerthella guodeyinii]MRX81749.1 hypothetical protein [Eggerthella guodeyinii]